MVCNERMQHLKKFHALALKSGIVPVAESGSSSIETSNISMHKSAHSHLSLDTSVLAGASKLPLSMLEGIWKKAAELLKTDGAVVPAPGMDSAMCVSSYGGKRPHLVSQKRGGNFACDSDCPNWKGLGICAHAVAAAEMCGKLAEFIAFYKRAKKFPILPNLLKQQCPKEGAERVVESHKAKR